VKALVFVAAFEPEAGESSLELTAVPGQHPRRHARPGGTLPEEGHDLYVQKDKFPHQFAADVPAKDAALMAVSQCPVKDAAPGEKAMIVAWEHIRHGRSTEARI
jgi:hypothetical protein